MYPNQAQREIIEKSFGCSRFVYNHMLVLKKKYKWLKEVDSTSLQSTIDDLDSAYKNFFRETKIRNLKTC
ncbi:helix-turn-helix domain-containing protein [Clostridioides sp. ES-S-0171-01]|nr:helix-turn-helix domain-containing protein [Clostridioides sp. ES-S-0171-01]MCC0687144.1 helix-turn-helix domain-containing protein [Clostridioides sp. ES-S-0056-01]MCC0714031.1 helix-turn-helix domain-containing protein [Clostridioides sp. ES-S-0077-01]UDN56385.1 helix-turn-helix domain-containing protein [Clostridioides sp. ES-S-0054-01]